MYYNDVPFGIIELQDVYAEQSFKLEKPFGHSDRADYEKLYEKESWKIKFEILSVYKGDKYDETAISEIYFDGLDVHCLGEGTKITMADKSLKNIELLKMGDKILSYNKTNNQFETSTIIELASQIHNNLIQIDFKNGTKIICTKDHPFLNYKNQWNSFNPKKTEKDYKIDNVIDLKVGTILKTMEGIIEVTKVSEINTTQKTYTIVKLSNNKTFIANGIITGIEELRIINHN